MTCKRMGFAVLLVILTTGPAAMSVRAQLATQPLLPDGQLFLPVSNHSGLDPENVRLYGGIKLTSGTEVLVGEWPFTGLVESEVERTTAALGVDGALAAAILSGGIFQEHTKFASGAKNLLTTLSIRATFPFGESDHFSLKADQITEKNESDQGVRPDETLEYHDLALGLGLSFKEHGRVGLLFSPEMINSEENRGHGMLTGLGLGYRSEDMAFEGEWVQEAESGKLGTGSTQLLGLYGEGRFDPVSLSGFYRTGSSGSFNDASVQDIYYGMEGRWEVGNTVLSMGYDREVTKYRRASSKRELNTYRFAVATDF